MQKAIIVLTNLIGNVLETFPIFITATLKKIKRKQENLIVNQHFCPVLENKEEDNHTEHSKSRKKVNKRMRI